MNPLFGLSVLVGCHQGGQEGAQVPETPPVVQALAPQTVEPASPPASTGPPAPGALHVDLRWTDGERSKDSHSTTSHYLVEGRSLTWSQTFSGFRSHSREDLGASLTLDEPQASAIWAAVEDPALATAGTFTGLSGSAYNYEKVRLTAEKDGVRRTLVFDMETGEIPETPHWRTSGPPPEVPFPETEHHRALVALSSALRAATR